MYIYYSTIWFCLTIIIMGRDRIVKEREGKRLVLECVKVSQRPVVVNRRASISRKFDIMTPFLKLKPPRSPTKPRKSVGISAPPCCRASLHYAYANCSKKVLLQAGGMRGVIGAGNEKRPEPQLKAAYALSLNGRCHFIFRLVCRLNATRSIFGIIRNQMQQAIRSAYCCANAMQVFIIRQSPLPGGFLACCSLKAVSRQHVIVGMGKLRTAATAPPIYRGMIIS